MTAASSLADLERSFAQLKGANLSLDLTRGKPSSAQLSLADALDGILAGDYRAADGTDSRNYGGLRGLAEARALGAELLDATPDEVLAFDSSSLMLMYLYIETALREGVRGPGSSWQAEAAQAGGRVKFLCPVPGYDRHFAICESLGIEMINIAMDDDGPDMDAVEAAVRADPLVKGIWCVPKHSNPTGCTYSEAVVRRFAALPGIAGAHFRIMWDNAYAVHDFGEPVPLLPLLPLARELGTADGVVMTTSTSKITFAGGGISWLATTPANLAAFDRRLGVMTIGPDKVNQLRHVRLLPDLAAVRAHMRRHGDLLRPKFDLVLQRLEAGLGEAGIARWTRPAGGYFVSLDTEPGCAREVVRLAGELGVKLTPAGATYPSGTDPTDSNIRIAPSFPTLDDVERAVDILVLCVKLAHARKGSTNT
jgi:aspartate/methionine/tyrosine aminotransferase